MDGSTLSLWTLTTKLTTVFRVFKNGARATIEAMFSDAHGTQVGILG